MKKNIILTVLIVVINSFLFAQNEYKYEFHGIVEDNNMPVSQVNIRIYQEQNLVTSQVSLSNGYYKFFLDFNTNYFIEFSKKGFKPKRIFISTKIAEDKLNSNLESNFFTINLIKGVSTGDEKVEFLQISDSTGDIIVAGNDLTNSKIIKAEMLANEILARAYFQADSIVNIAELTRDEIIENYKKYQTNQNSVIKNKNKIIEEYTDKDSIIVNSTQDSLDLINEIINLGKDKMEDLKKKLELAKKSNDTLLIAELQEELLQFDAKIKILKDMADKYETQISLQNITLQKRKNILIFFFVSSIFMIIIMIILFILFRVKRRTSIIMDKKNKLLKNQNTEILSKTKMLQTANDTITENNKILTTQKEEIFEQHKHITSSVNYAKTIQTAILPFQKDLEKHYENFILFLPKDIVSGDFYWHHEIENVENYTSIISIIDCTGHGVPGAFMSMIAYSVLNHIVKEKMIYEPKEILEELDKEIKISLRQQQTKNLDGMDLILCKLKKIDDKTTVYFSSAKRPLFRYNAVSNEMENFKGTRRSIGGNQKVRVKVAFETKLIETNKNDILYLHTDGYIDQNNKKRKRFGTPRMNKLLLENANKIMNEQKEILETELHKYKDSVVQRDDITVVGIKM